MMDNNYTTTATTASSAADDEQIEFLFNSILDDLTRTSNNNDKLLEKLNEAYYETNNELNRFNYLCELFTLYTSSSEINTNPNIPLLKHVCQILTLQCDKVPQEWPNLLTSKFCKVSTTLAKFQSPACLLVTNFTIKGFHSKIGEFGPLCTKLIDFVEPLLYETNHVYKKSEMCKFFYYIGMYNLQRFKFDLADRNLTQCFELLPRHYPEKKKKVLLLLFAARLTRGLPPTQRLLGKYDMGQLYPLVLAYKQGNIQEYRRQVDLFSDLFIQNQLYSIMKHWAYTGVLRNFIRCVCIGQASVSISELVRVLVFSTGGTVEMSEIEMECMLSNYVSTGLILGYLSHGAGKLALRKTNAFPSLYGKK